jgi:hypothetical protein
MPKSMPIPNDDNCDNTDITSFTIDARTDV